MSNLQLVSGRIPNSVRMLGIFALAASWLLLSPSAAHAFDIIQLTNNSTHDLLPAISGSDVVWQSCDGGSYPSCDAGIGDIYLWSGGTTTQITDNSTDDWLVDISGANVVWHRDDGNKEEIYLMRGAPPSAQLVPSISPGGLALLAGVVLGIVARARRGS